MTVKAIVITAPKEARIQNVEPPKLRDDYVLIKTKAVALNPTDWKHIASDPPISGARVGCDWAGDVLDVGKSVKGIQKGQRVTGFIHGANAVEHDDGSFAEIITAKEGLTVQIPDNLTYEDASTLGVGVTTVGQALYQSLQLPLPDQPSAAKTPILIYGGSTATGVLAIQYAKLSGFEVLVTCSPRNYDYVKSLGAVAAFDYNSKTCSDEIKDYTKGDLKYVFDCIAEGNSTPISIEAMSKDGGVYTTLLPVPDDKVKSINDKVQNRWTLAYNAIGEYSKFGGKDLPAIPEDYEFASKFWRLSMRLFAEGKLKVHRPSVNEGGKGLEGVFKGLDMLRDGTVSGKKLVYTLA